MTAQIYYDNANEAAAVVPVQFLNYITGAVADPTTVSCVVIDPLGNITSYNYPGSGGLNNILRASTGSYTLTLDGLTSSGLWTFVWNGSGGNVQQVTPGTFRLVPLSAVGIGMQYWYTSKEELKSRLSIAPSDTANDYEIALAVQCVTNWVNTYCGEHFYQLTETRTFMPQNIWTLGIDALVSTPSIVSSAVTKVDQDGDGVYEQNWGAPTFAGGSGNKAYTLKLGTEALGDNYNINSAGVPEPYRQLQVLTGIAGTTGPGQWLPYVWPFTFQNRVQITGTWGWNFVPPNVAQASLILAVDLFKGKDVAWGVAGMSDLGIVKVQQSPMVQALLTPYRNVRKSVGV